MRYHITGLISAVLSLLAVIGLMVQLRLIWRRKRHLAGGLSAERPTAVMSVLRYCSSFFAFYSFFVYGGTLKPFNHYVVWPRTVALLLLLTIIFEMAIDRRTLRAIIAFTVCLLALIGATILLAMRRDLPPWGRSAMQGTVVVATLLFIHGGATQIRNIRRSKSTGGLSLGMHQLFLGKDISTTLFGLSMGVAGWPIVLMSAVSTTFQTIVLWHFHWVKQIHHGHRSADPLAVEEPVEQAI